MKSLCLLTTKICKVMKNAKIVVVWEVRGHPRSSETSPFDKAHMTYYSTLIEAVHLSCTFLSYCAFLLKVMNFNPPTCICHPAPIGGDPIRILPSTLVSENYKSHGANVWHYLHNLTFSCFDTIS